MIDNSNKKKLIIIFIIGAMVDAIIGAIIGATVGIIIGLIILTYWKKDIIRGK